MIYLTLISGFLLLGLLIITPLTLEAQLLFGVTAVSFATIVILKHQPARKFIFAALVIAVSGRYIYWRVTQTMAFTSAPEYFLGWGMFAAEIYFLVILAGSYVQNLSPRQRKPVDMPADSSTWPTVDVFIPTYNEPLDIVSITVIAAKGIDWPEDKLKIYLLDDGRREEFSEFAASQGIGYITRENNQHAKAGNLNNALRYSSGELITIFDCDHVPTRSFLQTTVGWFLRDSRLALIQTPHHFYNADPFEKNLHAGGEGPREGLLFYGLVQDGNDFWNASFFCGSCAVLRRRALDEIGGFATETVTEDAHTSLRMHQKGWSSAFLKMPQASGLATGSLRAHVGQRLRWARGMLQIFRTENPFIIPSLSFAQRFCYANAMLHFLFPLPRIVLLTAPLAYLLFEVHIIVASPQAVVAYALPHIVVAVMASVYLQSKYRQIFSTEVYETSLAFHLIGPILLTLINPRLGKFNVTDKSRGTNDTYFDWRAVMPQLLVVAMLTGAVAYSLMNVASGGLVQDNSWTVVLNIVWAIISTVFLLLSIAVALEKGDRRISHRVRMDMPVVLQSSSGHSLKARLNEMSLTGASVEVLHKASAARHLVPAKSRVYIRLPYSHSSITLEGRVLRADENSLRITFAEDRSEQMRNRVRAIFGRADAWTDWEDVEPKGVMGAGKGMLKSVFYFIYWCVKSVFARRKETVPMNTQQVLSPHTDESGDEGRTLRRLGAAGQVATLLVAVGAGALWFTPSSVAAADENASISTSNDRFLITRDYSLELKDVGVTEPILLQGGDTSRLFSFSLRSDEVVASAMMKLRLSVSPGLDPQNSQLAVVINGETVHSMLLNADQTGISEVEFSVSPYVMLPDNSLEFRVLARKLGQDTNGRKTDKSVWVQISNASSLSLNVNRLPLSPDLNNLPAPFFDKRDHAELVLPFVFGDVPSRSTVQAAAVVASYWGNLASFRRASFPVLFNSLPVGNGVVFMTETARPDGLEDIRIEGSSLEIIANPRDVLSQLLLIKGRDDAELLVASRALSVGSLLVSGNATDVVAPIQQPRGYYDAPSWLPTNRPITFGEIEETADLEGYGLSPGVLTVNFKMAPDIFLWDSRGIPVHLKFRHPGRRWFDLENSRLDILVNDKFVTSIPLDDTSETLQGSGDFAQSVADFNIPPYLIYGENQLQFYFDLKTKVSEQNYHLLPGRVRVAIDSDSSIDMSSVYRYTRMPNLAYLAQSGLPFSRKADLSETAIVVPDGAPDKQMLQALFTLVATISGKTGYSASGIEVVNWQKVNEYPDYDFLVLGNFDNQPLLQQWSDSSPLILNGSYVSVASQSPYSKYRYKFNNLFSSEKFNPDQVVVPKTAMTSALYSHQSPLNPQRTVVGLLANQSEGLVKLVNALKSQEMSPAIKGDFFVLNEKEVLSFTTSEPYYVGHLPWYILIQWYVTSNAWLIPLLLVGGVVMLALSAFTLARARARKAFFDRDKEIAAALATK